MNTGKFTFKQKYMQVVYDFLVHHGILDIYIHDCVHSPNMHLSLHCEREPINFAINWARSQLPKDWHIYNSLLHIELCKLTGYQVTRTPTLQELLDFLEAKRNKPQPYEYW